MPKRPPITPGAEIFGTIIQWGLFAFFVAAVWIVLRAICDSISAHDLQELCSLTRIPFDTP